MSTKTNKKLKNSSKKKPSIVADFFFVFLLAMLLILVLHVSGRHMNNPLAIIVLIITVVPTVMAMINGAPFVPTPIERVRHMLKLAKIKPGNRVYDIGCGDGRIVYLAANEHGAKATGFELSPLVYLLAIIRKFFWKSQADIKFRNFKSENISDADIVFCYLLPDCLKSIKDNLLSQLKPGAKIVSYAFEVPEWELIHKEEKDPSQNFAPIWIYQKN
jgi:SAM-dependent methyltransferase